MSLWGRCMNDAVRKFLQFQINTNITGFTAVVFLFAMALTAQSEQSALGAVQLLWINLIMDACCACACNGSDLRLRSPARPQARQEIWPTFQSITVRSLLHISACSILHFLNAVERYLTVLHAHSPGRRHLCSLHDTVVQLLLHIGTDVVAVAVAAAAIQSLLHISAVAVAAAHCAILFFLIAAAALVFSSSSISPVWAVGMGSRMGCDWGLQVGMFRQKLDTSCILHTT